MAEPKEHSETLTIRYESEKHYADAKAVGETLLAIYAIIDEVSTACDSNEELLIKARPFAKGSLELPVDLIVVGTAILLAEYPLLQKIWDVLSGYFHTKQQLKGQSIHVKDGNVVLIDNSPVHIDHVTMQCLDPGNDVSRRCSEAFLAIKDDPEIKAVEIRSSNSANDLVRVERSEFEYFQTDTTIGEQNLGEREIETRETLVIRQPSFDSDLTWRFIWNGIPITAKMRDEAFQKKVEAGLDAFVAGDTLDVDLLCLQKYEPASQTHVNKKYTITRVRGHVHPPGYEQLNLFN